MRGFVPLLAVGGLLMVPTPAAATPTTTTLTSAQAVHPAKKNLANASLSRLRIAIHGAPEARIAVKGPQTKVTITDSSVLKVPAGSYRLRARSVLHRGDSFSPDQRTWRVSLRKGSVAIVSVHYDHVGSFRAAPTQQSATPASEDLSTLLALVNEARSRTQQCGTKTMRAVSPVAYDSELAEAAQRHAQDMADNSYFDHDSLDGRSLVDRVKATDYSGDAAGENIAMGFQTPQAALAGWLASPGHCTNLMQPDFDEMGLGVASFHDPRYSQPVTYWVQDFGYAASAR